MINVISSKVTLKQEENVLISKYDYENSHVLENNGSSSTSYVVEPVKKLITLKTDLSKPKKLGVMLIGWGGNNGSTLTASLIANKKQLSWQTRNGIQRANYFGSLVMSSTVKLGISRATGETVHVPMNTLLPMVHPEDIVLGGWDINSANLAEAMDRACVLEPTLKSQVYDEMRNMVPLPSIYDPDFIAANQLDRADNLITGSKKEQLDVVRSQIKQFKRENEVEKVIVLWTANTERFCDVVDGVHDKAENVLKAIDNSHMEISPSSIFAVAAILEGCPFINGSPQNTLIPGVIDLAEKKNVPVAGDDFKSGQTKLKSVLVDFLVNAGIKPVAITSYNHLGNNDGKNLSAPAQFRSKEISKTNVVDDMVRENHILYSKNENPDHVVVIKYVPSVGDSKRALDEYESEIFMGGKNTISLHNVCEDSLLASPLILDLVILMEFFSRVQYKAENMDSFSNFHPVYSILSYMLKAPVVPNGAKVVNALFKQRQAIENILRACCGLSPLNEMDFESRCPKAFLN